MNVQDILAQNDHLTGRNGSWRAYWQDLADYCLPRKAWMTTLRMDGDTPTFNYLYDSTAIGDVKVMAAGFHSNLTNPASKWFALQARRTTLMQQRHVKLWFNEVEDRLFAVINASNFDTTMQNFYMESGVFGTSVILTDADPTNKVRYLHIPLEQVNIVEDANGRVTALYRNFPLTADQAFRLWGEDAGRSVLEAIRDKKPFQSFDFLHYTALRHVRQIGKIDNRHMPIASLWIAKKDKHVIKESGFEEFPYAVGRFYKDGNEVFGYSPAMDAFPEIKGVNGQQRTLLRAGMKQTDPPLTAPDSGYVLPLNLNPGAMNYYQAKMGEKGAQMIQPIMAKGNLAIGVDLIERTQQRIDEAFFVPLFRSLTEVTKQMTVLEVQRRIAENMVLLGPVVGRFTHEVLSPLVVRTFNILFRLGELPPPPKELVGEEMDVVYLSPLAKAQRSSERTSITTFLSIVAQVAAVKPDALDNIDEDEVVTKLADIEGVDPAIIRDAKDVEAIRKDRADQMAQQQQLAVAGAGAQIVKTGAEAGKAMHEAEAEA